MHIIIQLNIRADVIKQTKKSLITLHKEEGPRRVICFNKKIARNREEIRFLMKTKKS